MDTKLATKQIRLNEWAGIIKDCKASGLKVDEYCQRNSISRDAYYYWLRKVKEAALIQAGFVELPSPGSRYRSGTRDFESQIVIRIREADILVNAATPPELIAKVLGMVRNA